MVLFSLEILDDCLLTTGQHPNPSVWHSSNHLSSLISTTLQPPAQPPQSQWHMLSRPSVLPQALNALLGLPLFIGNSYYEVLRFLSVPCRTHHIVSNVSVWFVSPARQALERKD